MGPVMTLLSDAAKKYALEEGCFEIRNQRSSVVEVYFSHGKVYAAMPHGVMPPFVKRSAWSVHQKMHSPEVKKIVSSVSQLEVINAILAAELVEEPILKEYARDFFLHTIETTVNTWTGVTGKWTPGKTLPEESTGYSVYPLDIPTLQSTIETRVSDIIGFANWLGIKVYEVNQIVIHVAMNMPTIAYTRDADNLVVTLAENGATLNQLIKESGWMGTSTITKAIYRMYQKGALTIKIGNQLMSPPKGPEDIEVFPPLDTFKIKEEEKVEESEIDISAFELPKNWFVTQPSSMSTTTPEIPEEKTVRKLTRPKTQAVPVVEKPTLPLPTPTSALTPPEAVATPPEAVTEVEPIIPTVKASVPEETLTYAPPETTVITPEILSVDQVKTDAAEVKNIVVESMKDTLDNTQQTESDHKEIEKMSETFDELENVERILKEAALAKERLKTQRDAIATEKELLDQELRAAKQQVSADLTMLSQVQERLQQEENLFQQEEIILEQFKEALEELKIKISTSQKSLANKEASIEAVKKDIADLSHNVEEQKVSLQTQEELIKSKDQKLAEIESKISKLERFN